jgi:hypothetical protein
VVDREQLRRTARASLAWVWNRSGPEWSDRFVSALMLASILFGLWARARGYLFETPAFWLDESQWAMNLTTRSLGQNMIRPPGFILVSKALAVLMGPTETVLRTLPWLAGMTLTIFSPALASRLYRSATSRLFFVAVIALNPCAIDFSKEFKPYSIGLMLHLALILLALRYVESQKMRDLGWVLGTAVVGSIFTQDLVFAFPGLFALLAWETFRSRRTHLAWVAGAAGVLIVLLLAQYFFLWRRLPKDGSEYWGNKYRVFYTGKRASSYFSWSLERFRDMTGLPGIRRNFWQEGGVTSDQRHQIRTADRVVWLALHLMGMMVIVWRRRWREGVLIVPPLVVMWAFNALGLWPLGAFRTNVFSLSYLTAIAAMAFDVPGNRRFRWLSAVPTLVLVFLPIAVFEKVWHARKQAYTYDSKFPELMGKLVTIGNNSDTATLLIDRRSCDPWRFYTKFHPEVSVQYEGALADSYDARCIKDDKTIPDELIREATTRRAVWVILHVGHNLDTLVRTGKLYPLYRISRFEVGPHTVMSFRRRPTRPAVTPPALPPLAHPRPGLPAPAAPPSATPAPATTAPAKTP